MTEKTAPELTADEAMRLARRLLSNAYKNVDEETAVYVALCNDKKKMRSFLRSLKDFCNKLIKALEND